MDTMSTKNASKSKIVHEKKKPYLFLAEPSLIRRVDDASLAQGMNRSHLLREAMRVYLRRPSVVRACAEHAASVGEGAV